MNRTTLRLIGAVAVVGALGLAAPALATLGGPPGSPDNNVTVNQDSFDTSGLPGATGWATMEDSQKPSGIEELVAGPKTPPKGSGSLRLTTSDAGQLTTVSNASDFSGVLLKDIVGAKYSTYTDEDSTSGPAAISLKLAIPGTTLVYEPYLASAAYSTSATARGAWYEWDVAAPSTKGWWDSKNISGCTQALPCSFAAIKSAVDFGGTVKVSDARLAIGSGIARFDGNVDKLEVTVGGQKTQYDFESTQVNSDVVTRVDETNGDGWTFDGSAGTAPNGAYAANYTAGPGFPGQSGAGSANLNNRGVGSYSSIVQDYFEGNGDITQKYLGSLDNIEAWTYKLSTSTNGDYPSVRFEVRVPDPSTQFEFTSLVNFPSPATTDAIDKVSAIHPATGTADTATWQLSQAAAGLQAWTPYTWAQLMNSDLRDAVILKARVMAGTAGSGEFHGGVDLLKFSYRDGSSKTWDFEKSGYPVPTAPNAPTALGATTSPTSKNVVLSWTDNSDNENGFAIERSTSSTFATVTSSIVGPNITTYTDKTGLAATTYYYRVRAGNNVGYSAYSNTATATTGTPPAGDTTAPTVSITTEDGSVFLPTESIEIAGTAMDTGLGSTGVTRIIVKVEDEFGLSPQYYDVCGGTASPCANTSPTVKDWSFSFGVTTVQLDYPPVAYAVTAYAYDAAGNLANSETINIVALK